MIRLGLACAALVLAASARADDNANPRRLDGGLVAAPAAHGQRSHDALGGVNYETPNPYAGPAPLQGRTPSIAAMPPSAASDPAVEAARLANSRMALADYEGALAPLSRLIDLRPQAPEPYVDRARAENELQRYAQAQADAARAVRLDPDSARGWSQLAYASARQDGWLQALKASERAIQLDPNDATAYYVRYLGAGHAGDMPSAYSALEWAARLDSRFVPLDQRVRRDHVFIDPKDDKTPPAAPRPWSGLPWWQIALAAVLLFGSSATAVSLSWLKAVRNKVHSIKVTTPAFAVGLPGRQRRMIGKYEVSHLIGRGGMGDVYEAKDLALERPVAIKRISDQLSDMAPKARSMLIQEAKVVASLHHPAIVDIYEILEDGKDVYLVFEFVKGVTAHQILSERGRLPVNRAAEILRPVCKALDFAHGHGLVHRDLKPANIMVTDDGYVKLMDFGIARSLLDAAQVPPGATPPPKPADGPWARPWSGAAEDLAQPTAGGTMAQGSSVVGTPSYMAPEMDSGIVSRQGDLYALGVCLYELVTGRVPFPPHPGYSSEQKLRMEYAKARDLVPLLPAGLDELIALCLQPDPRKRLQSPREFLSRLDAVVTPAPVARPT